MELILAVVQKQKMMNSDKSKSERAYEVLRRDILSGVIAPGERLTETKLASELGLGRMPVRESLWRLEAEGFVKGKAGRRGKFVEYLEDDDPEDVLRRYEMREAIEPMAIWLAAKNMNGWQVETFAELTNALAKCPADDPKARREARQNCSRFLYENCGNPLLLRAYEEFGLVPSQARSAEIEHKILSQIPDEKRKRVKMENVVAAIAAHDADEAEKLARENIRMVTAAIRKVIRSGEWAKKRHQETQ